MLQSVDDFLLFGYYGWPWHRWACRAVLYVFVFALPVGAAVGCFAEFRGTFLLRRFVVPFIAVLVGLFGVFAMLEWRSRYVEPILHRSLPASVFQRL